MLPKTKENGFTLIEMLFILLILSLLMVIAVPNLFSLLKKLETNNFFHMLDADIFYIQNEAMDTQNNVRIIFREDAYVIRNLYSDEDIIRYYPDNLSYDLVNNRIMFNKNGTILGPTRYRFFDKNNTYEIVFPLGKGRHYIEKY